MRDAFEISYGAPKVETITCKHKCTDKETCNHNCCKGKTKQTDDLMVLMRNGNTETHKLSCQDDATQQAHGELSEDSFWDEPDHHQFHQTVANICVQPNQNGDFAYTFSDEETDEQADQQYDFTS